MRIENSFDVPVPLERAWEALTDIERIVPCMPGATLTEVVDEKTYKGSVAIRLGPVALSFDGTAVFEEMDPVEHRAVVRTQGRDGKGRGNVDADVQFQLEALDAATRVLVTTDLKLSGTVAQYGRGAGMIADVAGRWVKSFSDCLSEQLSRESSPDDAAAALQPETSAAEPMPVLGLGFKVLLGAVRRAIRRLFRG